MKHICKPRYKPLFSLDQYQCGCGRYFTKEQMEGRMNETINKLTEMSEKLTGKRREALQTSIKILKRVDEEGIGNIIDDKRCKGCYGYPETPLKEIAQALVKYLKGEK